MNVSYCTCSVMFCDLANLGLLALWTLWWTCYIVYLCSLWSTYHIVNLWSMWSICNVVHLWSLWSTCYIVNLWSLWSTCYIVNCELVVFVIFVNFVVLWTCYIDIFSYWYGYRLYLRFRPVPMYFSYRTFDFDVSEIPLSFPFPKLPFPISFPIKNMKMVTVLVFSDRFRPVSPLPTTDSHIVQPFSCLPALCILHGQR